MADENTEEGAGGAENAAQQANAADAAKTSGENAGEAGKTGDAPDQGKASASDGEQPKEGEAKADDKGEKKPEEKAGAPDEYEAFTLPEGVQADEEALTEFKEFAKSENLTQEQAQKYVDLHVKSIDKILAGQMDRWEKQKEEWRTQTEGDKDLHGADGTVSEAVSIAKQAVVKLGGTELQDVLDLLGASNHPLVVKAFFKAGKAMSDDEFVFGGGSGDNRTPAQKLFPSMK